MKIRERGTERQKGERGRERERTWDEGRNRMRI